jgi:hypothetical protein
MLQGISLDRRRTALWSSELKIETSYFGNVKGFKPINDKILNVV